MDRLANLEVVLDAAGDAVKNRDWPTSEKLSERIRSIVLDMAMADDRDALARARDRMMAFRVAAGGRLNRDDPTDAPFAMILRYDAALAAIAARMRPKALPATLDKEHGNAPERVLRFLLARPGGATTGEIVQRVGLAQGTVSKLLTSLKAQGLVTSRRSGKHVFSRLTPRGRRAAGERPQRPHPRQIVRAYSPVPTRMATLLNEWHAPGGMPLPAPSEIVAAAKDHADAMGSRLAHLNVIDRAAKDEDETPINMYASAVG